MPLDDVCSLSQDFALCLQVFTKTVDVIATWCFGQCHNMLS